MRDALLHRALLRVARLCSNYDLRDPRTRYTTGARALTREHSLRLSGAAPTPQQSLSHHCSTGGVPFSDTRKRIRTPSSVAAGGSVDALCSVAAVSHITKSPSSWWWS